MFLTFEADTAEELHAKVANYARVCGLLACAHGAQMDLPFKASAVVPAPVAEITAPAPKRGRPKKVKESEPVSAPPSAVAEETAAPELMPAESEPVVTEVPAAETAVQAPVEVEPATKEQAIAALTEVNGKLGMSKARELLARFGANRMSEVKAEDYGRFVMEARSLTA